MDIVKFLVIASIVLFVLEIILIVHSGIWEYKNKKEKNKNEKR